MIHAVVFDLDGVIRNFPESATADIEIEYGLKSGTLNAVAFDPALLELLTTGKISRLTWIKEIGQRVGSTESADAWGRIEPVVDHDVLQLIDDLQHAGITTAILTNGNDTIDIELERQGIAAHVAHVFNSAKIGYSKPDRRAFLHVIDALHLRASEILFTDDSAAKLLGATRLGIHTHHLASASALRAILTERGDL
ncbi:HAD-IA family hydrolase [Glutamicibacter sp.]|uniref:HAD-IA family hydrolase n=1 Tax=Glutamicibacter sp. TaxID=1931995 RepID=UPI003D6B0B44